MLHEALLPSLAVVASVAALAWVRAWRGRSRALADIAEIDNLLRKTSRTFALAIPLLPSPSPRLEASVAYLLLRIADTFEDATRWPRQARLEALADFCRVLRDPMHTGISEMAKRWVEAKPTDHAGYLELLEKAPFVVGQLDKFAPKMREIVLGHSLRIAEGMASFVSQSDEAGKLRLGSVDELRKYCYVVSGIGGELLADLFVEFSEKARSVGPFIRECAVLFSEGLQLVNILKDRDDDAKEGRCFIPEGVSVGDLRTMAERDLRAAADSALALQRVQAPSGIILFVALPAKLAAATLPVIIKDGPRSKIGRAAVLAALAKLHIDIATNTPVF